MNRLIAFASGVLFSLGLAVSGMTHPGKVLAFLDVAGDWDPSLALVMGGGVVVNAILFRLALRRGAPLLAPAFSLPPRRAIDHRLILGAALFGVGWGLGGFCPGPAVVSLAAGGTPVVAFVASMVSTMTLYEWTAGRVRMSDADSRSLPAGTPEGARSAATRTRPSS
jgi:uncharacterized membrane protein YedE/YeeE